MENPFINELQQLLNECPRINGKVVEQDCEEIFGEMVRFVTKPSKYISTEDPFSGIDLPAKIAALGTLANWQALLDVSGVPQSIGFISPAIPFGIKNQENPEKMSTESSFPNGQPKVQNGGEYEEFIFTFYGLSAANETALQKLKGTQQHFIGVDKYGKVIAKNISLTTDSFFFKATMINVSNRIKVMENNPLGDMIKVKFAIELGELDNWKKYTEAQAFSLTVLPTP